MGAWGLLCRASCWCQLYKLYSSIASFLYVPSKKWLNLGILHRGEEEASAKVAAISNKGIKLQDKSYMVAKKQFLLIVVVVKSELLIIDEIGGLCLK